MDGYCQGDHQHLPRELRQVSEQMSSRSQTDLTWIQMFRLNIYRVLTLSEIEKGPVIKEIPVSLFLICNSGFQIVKYGLTAKKVDIIVENGLMWYCFFHCLSGDARTECSVLYCTCVTFSMQRLQQLIISRSDTKLGPEAFRFTDAIEARALKQNER